MFEAIAKRQLEKNVARLVQEKGAAWIIQSKLVQTELLQKQPKQQINIAALNHVVATSSFAYLLSLPDPATDTEAISRVTQRVQECGLDETAARWAVGCWIAALAPFSFSQRTEVVNQIKAELEAQRQIAATEAEQLRLETAEQERRRIEDERWRVENERRKREEAQAQERKRKAEAQAAQAEAALRQPVIERWRMAFPREAAAIEEAAGLAAQAQERAEATKSNSDADRRRKATQELYARYGPDPEPKYDLGSFGSSDRTSRDREIDKLAEKYKRERISQLTPDVNAEIWRRIKTAPDQKALQQKMEEACEAERERRHIEAQHKRAEKERQAELQAEEKKQAQVQDWRQRFPLQCAGLSDEEVSRQISKKP